MRTIENFDQKTWRDASTWEI